ncbi:MAG: Hsp20/alpha crystallin family protein [Meiothermus sp.]|nr:Hsp20/alpha crystallin family protein [Meiothermus sp.]
MSIERYNAVEKLQNIRQQLDELTRRFSSGTVFGEWVPAMDVLDEGSQYRIVLDVPGVNNDDLELSEDSNTVTIAGVRYSPQGQYTRQERSAGQFTRAVEFPEAIEPGSAEASLKGGVLEVVIQKKVQKGRRPRGKK